MTRKKVMRKLNRVMKDWEDNPERGKISLTETCYSFCPIKRPVKCFTGEEIRNCPIYHLVADMKEADFIRFPDDKFKISILDVINRKEMTFCSSCGCKLKRGKNVPADFHLPFCNNCRVELAEQTRKECEKRNK